jgi:hypothetical protein
VDLRRRTSSLLCHFERRKEREIPQLLMTMRWPLAKYNGLRQFQRHHHFSLPENRRMKSPRLMSSTSAKALFAQRNGLLNSLVLNMSQSPIEGFFALAQNDTATVDSTNISDISQRREPSQNSRFGVRSILPCSPALLLLCSSTPLPLRSPAKPLSLP